MKLIPIVFLSIFIAFGWARVKAESNVNTGLMIVELKTASEDSAGDEFIEVANISSQVIELDGISFEYRSATGQNWLNKAQLSGQLLPNKRIVIGAGSYTSEASFSFSSGLAAGGGHVRLYNADSDKVLTSIGYGNAEFANLEPASEADKHQSLKRVVDEDGYFSDHLNDSLDWILSDNPTPVDDGLYTPPKNNQPSEQDPIVEKPPTGYDDPITEKPETNHYARVLLSELLPDPVAPLSDADDEFIELSNPNGFKVSLDGYYARIGSRSTILDGYSIEANSFVAIYSSDVSMSLANSGKTIELFDPNSLKIDSAEYPSAEPGKSWSYFSSGWSWADPSPGATNVFEELFAESDDEANLGAVDKDRDYSISESGQTLSGSDSRTVFTPAPEAEIAPIDYSVLAGVGALSVCYVIYEYRQDLGNRIHQLRRHIENRRENRATPKGRRSDRIGQRYRRWKDDLRAWTGRWYQKYRPGR